MVGTAATVAPNTLNQRSFLQRAHTILPIIGGLYVLAVLLLAVPFFQRQCVSLVPLSNRAFSLRTIHQHRLLECNTLTMGGKLYNARGFWSCSYVGSQYTSNMLVEHTTLIANKTYNLAITTPDNKTLGAWYILSDKYYHNIPTEADLSPSHITKSLSEYPTILYFHGNAGTRAFHVRVAQYTALTARLGANILAIDYRGFGDSSGEPSEEGLALDARAAWNWLAQHGAKPEDVLIMGHSLGTGVSGRLASTLSSESVPYRGLVLMSPFSSILELLKTYSIMGVLPLMKPLSMIPFATGKHVFHEDKLPSLTSFRSQNFSRLCGVGIGAQIQYARPYPGTWRPLIISSWTEKV